MNASPESLYQLTQNLEPPLTSIAISAEAVKSYVEAIIDLAIEQQLEATILVKLPQTKTWFEAIQKYYQTGRAKNIYLCNVPKKQLRELDSNAEETQVIPLELAKTSLLQREAFLIVLSSQFCTAIVSQWQRGQIIVEPAGKRLAQPYLQMVTSFQPSVVEKILAGVEPIVVTGNTMAEDDLKISAAIAPEATLFDKLVLKQITGFESLRTNNSNNSNSVIAKQSPAKSALGLQPDFLSGLARELRSPITHMKTALSLLESKQIKGEQRQRYLQMIGKECDRQNSLVHGLLELLQLNTPTEFKRINLGEFVPGIVSTYQPLAKEQNIQLGYTIPTALPPVSCPAVWLRQIIINLLNNSLQFTSAGGKVYVQASLKDELIELSVADTGIGINFKDTDKIFDSFYSTKAIGDRQTGGAGLGLTIVKQLVNRIGGSIEVSSKVGKGTSFKILLPPIPAELI